MATDLINDTSLNNLTSATEDALRELQATLLVTQNNLNDFFIVISAVLVFGKHFSLFLNHFTNID